VRCSHSAGRQTSGKVILHLLAVAALLMSGACSRQSSIRRSLSKGDTAPVIEFVKKQINDPNTWDDIQFAFTEAASTRSTPVLATCEDLALSKAVGRPTRERLIHLFAASRVAFQHPPLFLAAAVHQEVSENAVADIIKVLTLSPLETRLAAISGQILPLEPLYVDDSTFSRDDRALRLAASTVPEKSANIENLSRLLNAAHEQSAALKSVWDGMVSDINSRDELGKKISEMNTAANSQQPFILSAYIVGEHSPGVYEIAMPNDPREHAFLFSFSHTFQSKGYFSMRVERMAGELPVQLKEEYGNFTQNWKAYSECDNSCLNRKEEARAEQAKIQGDLSNKLRSMDEGKSEFAKRERQLPGATGTFNLEACSVFGPCDFVQPGFYVVTGKQATYVPFVFGDDIPGLKGASVALEQQKFRPGKFAELGTDSAFFLYGEEPHGEMDGPINVVAFVGHGKIGPLESVSDNVIPRATLADFFSAEKVGESRGRPLTKLVPKNTQAEFFAMHAEAAYTNENSNVPVAHRIDPKYVLVHLAPAGSRQNLSAGDQGAFSPDRMLELQATLSQHWNRVLEMPEVQRSVRRVFSNDIAEFREAISGPGGGGIKDDYLMIQACKAHDCPSHGAVITLNLRDGKSAGALYTDSAVTVHMGDFAGPSELPQSFREWLDDSKRSVANNELKQVRYVK
jgi:hypothetical protein